MKRSIQIFVCLALFWAAPSSARASLLDWFLSKSADWRFVQSTGGMQILSPNVTDGKVYLPVLYDASGLSQITCKPTAVNSGLVVEKITVKRAGTNIILHVKVCMRKDQGSTEGSGSVHYADLSGIPNGTYQIFYGHTDDPAKILGQIKIQQPQKP